MNLSERKSSDSIRNASRLSDDLRNLAGKASTDSLTLGELMLSLEGRVYTLLLVLLSVPFCQPISLPGLSTPFGVVIALLGLRFALRQKPWLPARLLSLTIPSRHLPAVLRGCAKILHIVEKFLHPRMTWIFAYSFTQFLAGCTIFLCGILLLLPLPIPFSNLLPALTVVLLAASFSERDGAMLAAGWVVFLITLLFFAAIFLGGVEFIDWIKNQFSGFFDPKEEAPGLFPPTQ